MSLESGKLKWVSGKLTRRYSSASGPLTVMTRPGIAVSFGNTASKIGRLKTALL